MPQSDWKNLLNQSGEEFADFLKATIRADLFLLAAVESVDIDWCIHRLREIKRKQGKVETILDIVIPSGEQSPRALHSTEPTPELQPKQ